MTEDFSGCSYEPGLAEADPLAIAEAMAILKPKASPKPLIRIGGTKDGAYLLPDDLDGIVACFSPGVYNFKNFEDELAKRHGIRSHMCDFSSDVARFRTPLIPGMQTFDKAWLDLAGVPDSLQLDTWVNDLYPDPAQDLMLQIDIEGAEYRNILSCSSETLRRFRIITLELHRLKSIRTPDVLEQIILPFLRKLDEDFICVHVHPNNCGGQFNLPGWSVMPNAIEMTMLRRDRFGLHAEGERFAPDSPHPLDIVSNGLHRAPLFLDEHWLEGPRSTASTIRMLEHKLAFEQMKSQKLEARVEDLAARMDVLASSLEPEPVTA